MKLYRKSSILLNYQMLNFKEDNLSNNEFGINQFFVLVQIKF